MSKTYTYLMNSSIATNQVTSTTSDISQRQYNINWKSFLPLDIEKFDVSFVFRSSVVNGDPATPILLSLDFGSRTIYSQSNTQSNILGAIVPKSYVVSGTTCNFMYESNNTDDSGFMASYPTNTTCTLNITNYAGVLISATGLNMTTNFPNSYVLQLSFTEIEK